MNISVISPVLDKIVAVTTGSIAVVVAQSPSLPSMTILEKSVLGVVIVLESYAVFALWRQILKNNQTHKEEIANKDAEIKRLNEKVIDEVKRIANDKGH